jgi:hypothetical protein
MKKPKYLIFIVMFKSIFLILVYINVFDAFSTNKMMMLFLWIFSMLLMVNDHIRNQSLREYTFLHDISLIATIIGCGILKYTISGIGTNAYFLFSLVEIFMFAGKIPLIFFMLHAIIYFILILVPIKAVNNLNSIYELSTNLFGYLFLAALL